MNANSFHRVFLSFGTGILALVLLAVLVIAPTATLAASNCKQGDEPTGAPAIIPTPEGRRASAVALLGMIHTLEDIYFATATENDGAGVYGDFKDFQDMNYIDVSTTTENYLMGFNIYWFLNSDRTDYAIVAIPAEFPEMTGIMVGSSGTIFALAEIPTEGDLGPFGPVIEALDESKGSDGTYSFVNMADFNESHFMMNLYLTEDEDEYGIIMTEDTPEGIGGAAMFGFSDSGYVVMEYTPDLPVLSEDAI